MYLHLKTGFTYVLRVVTFVAFCISTWFLRDSDNGVFVCLGYGLLGGWIEYSLSHWRDDEALRSLAFERKWLARSLWLVGLQFAVIGNSITYMVGIALTIHRVLPDVAASLMGIVLGLSVRAMILRFLLFAFMKEGAEEAIPIHLYVRNRLRECWSQRTKKA